MLRWRLHFLSYFTLCYCAGLFQDTNCSPVLVLVANGSDITINFPGENNNNRVFSIVSSSGNNNPSMFDWIGGNGANKAPTILLGKSNEPAMPPSLPKDYSAEDDDTLPSNRKPVWGKHGLNEFEVTDGIFPLVSTASPTTLPNVTTISVPYTHKFIAAPV